MAPRLERLIQEGKKRSAVRYPRKRDRGVHVSKRCPRRVSAPMTFGMRGSGHSVSFICSQASPHVLRPRKRHPRYPGGRLRLSRLPPGEYQRRGNPLTPPIYLQVGQRCRAPACEGQVPWETLDLIFFFLNTETEAPSRLLFGRRFTRSRRPGASVTAWNQRTHTRRSIRIRASPSTCVSRFGEPPLHPDDNTSPSINETKTSARREK